MSSILPSYSPLATTDAHFRGSAGSSTSSAFGGAPRGAGDAGLGLGPQGGTAPAHLFIGAGRSPTVPEFLRRIGDWRQMDFESAFDQMITLLSTEPARV
jgi:hypothetical protein